jgi:hypothetical protein
MDAGNFAQHRLQAIVLVRCQVAEIPRVILVGERRQLGHQRAAARCKRKVPGAAVACRSDTLEQALGLQARHDLRDGALGHAQRLDELRVRGLGCAGHLAQGHPFRDADAAGLHALSKAARDVV